MLYIIQELKVKNVVIGKQFENSENLQKFKETVKRNNINFQVVEARQKINIEKNICIDILWPEVNNKITEEPLNNNSLICKLKYGDFSCLFTGDIEEEAERKLINIYKETNILKSNILKVAHHGSKTSSTQEFLEAVNPKIALIGVGKNNNFGHPSNEVIQRLQNKGTKIYRTDEDGEIIISINTQGKYRIDKVIKSNQK